MNPIPLQARPDPALPHAATASATGDGAAAGAESFDNTLRQHADAASAPTATAPSTPAAASPQRAAVAETARTDATRTDKPARAPTHADDADKAATPLLNLLAVLAAPAASAGQGVTGGGKELPSAGAAASAPTAHAARGTLLQPAAPAPSMPPDVAPTPPFAALHAAFGGDGASRLTTHANTNALATMPVPAGDTRTARADPALPAAPLHLPASADAGAWNATLLTALTQVPVGAVAHGVHNATLAASPGAAATGGSAQAHLVGTPAWSEALGSDVAWMAGQGVGSARLRLHPESLGSMDIQLSVQHGGRVDVSFVVQHPAAAAAVQDALAQLGSQLGQHGLTLGDTSVAQRQARDGGQGTSAGAGMHARGPGADDADAPMAISATPGRLTAGLLDAYV